MKNIHVLPTDKPSRLRYNLSNVLVLTKESYRDYGKQVNQNIYITSDEEIKEGDWVIEHSLNWVFKIHKHGLPNYNPNKKKIILTDNKDLIKDGVQAIDDDFLEWFVKNPTCEEVEVEREKSIGYAGDRQRTFYGGYKIIIPKEEPKQTLGEIEATDAILKKIKDLQEQLVNLNYNEEPKQENCCTPIGQIKRYVDCKGCDRKPKQETLEEAKLRQLFKNRSNCYADTGRFENDGSYSEGEVIQAMDEDCFINVIKEWQQERMYSEEDMRKCWDASKRFERPISEGYAPNFNELIEQFKKK